MYKYYNLHHRFKLNETGYNLSINYHKLSVGNELTSWIIDKKECCIVNHLVKFINNLSSFSLIIQSI